MSLHDLKLKSDICEQLILFTAKFDLQSQHEATRGDRDGTSAFISRTKGGIRESTTVKDKNMFVDQREYLILTHYENHQESGYTNYAHQDMAELVPDKIFDHFSLDRHDCKVDVKKFSPGKIHIPHKDYYINYIYNMVDCNGVISYENKANYDISRPVIRLWITLTEPKFGHILIVENKTYYNLPQGSIVTWNPDELHTAANLGYEDRFIMTITGQVKS